MNKERLDVLLVNRGFFESRERAKAAIMAGLVYIGEERADKAGVKVSLDANIRVKGELHPYVGRGGLKLEKALEVFNIDVKDKIGIDIGASTGGFTDCALQHGAKKIFAVDVGYGQLAWSLRQDERVVVMERTNFRYLTLADLNGIRPEFATIDVSFISLSLILPNLCNLLVSNGEVIALVKPQFEAGKEQVGKNGIVRDKQVHFEVLRKILQLACSLHYLPKGITFSPIQGGEGNIEYLLYLIFKNEETISNPISDSEIVEIVNQAHEQF